MYWSWLQRLLIDDLLGVGLLLVPLLLRYIFRVETRTAFRERCVFTLVSYSICLLLSYLPLSPWFPAGPWWNSIAHYLETGKSIAIFIAYIAIFLHNLGAQRLFPLLSPALAPWMENERISWNRIGASAASRGGEIAPWAVPYILLWALLMTELTWWGHDRSILVVFAASYFLLLALSTTRHVRLGALLGLLASWVVCALPTPAGRHFNTVDFILNLAIMFAILGKFGVTNESSPDDGKISLERPPAINVGSDCYPGETMGGPTRS